MSYEHRSLGKRSQPHHNSSGIKDATSSFTRKREQKELAGRDTSDTVANDEEKAGQFDNFPDIPERSAQLMISKGFKYLFPIQ